MKIGGNSADSQSVAVVRKTEESSWRCHIVVMQFVKGPTASSEHWQGPCIASAGSKVSPRGFIISRLSGDADGQLNLGDGMSVGKELAVQLRKVAKCDKVEWPR